MTLGLTVTSPLSFSFRLFLPLDRTGSFFSPARETRLVAFLIPSPASLSLPAPDTWAVRVAVPLRLCRLTLPSLKEGVVAGPESTATPTGGWPR